MKNSCYILSLTPSGLFRLWRRVRDRPTHFAWFSVREMAEGKTQDGGNTAYLKALQQAFGNDAANLEDTL